MRHVAQAAPPSLKLVHRVLLRAACAVVLVIILAAGLWPFHAPKNKVRWLSNENGLRFDKYSSIVTEGEFKSTQTNESSTIEIWVEPRRVYVSGTILAFYRAKSHISPFALRQVWGDLVLEKPVSPSKPAKSKVDIANIFTGRKPVLLTVSSDPAGTAIYADGALIRQLPDFRFSTQDLTGKLLVGNAPFSTHEWIGQLRGLAIYDRALSPQEATQHYIAWTESNNSVLFQKEHAIALYLFDEHSGNLARNLADVSTGLTIPQRFFILHEQFLARPWDEYRHDWRYWKDIAINVAGFVPLGFLFFSYFSLMRKAEYSLPVTIALGFGVSLTIELLQSLLPTRNSGMTDLITNTLGTVIGVFFFKLDLAQRVLAAAGIHQQKANMAHASEHSMYDMMRAGATDSAR